MSCIFCDIVNRTLPTQCIYEDELVFVFEDIHPQAPTHLLLIPKIHIESLNAINESHSSVLSHLLLTVNRLAKELHLADAGYRVVMNTNDDGGQTVYHLHLHLLAGRRLTWPPG